MGDTKLQFDKMQETIKKYKEEIESLKKKLVEAETNANVGDT